MALDADQVRLFREQSDACPIPHAVALIGERWTCLIVRAALLGLRHFEEFQACLGIARNILSTRLAHLVEQGILARAPDPEDGRKVIYTLTELGAGLLPVVAALRQWALDAGFDHPDHPHLCDARDRKPIQRIGIAAHDGRPLEPGELVWIDAAGTDVTLPTPARRRRTAAA